MPIAIGDIHGCLESLEKLVAQLPAEQELVFLGDYVDRGPQSAQVVAYLKALGKQRPCQFLMGNHESMLMTAVVEEEAIPHWLQNGGSATLLSYGVDWRTWAQSPQRGAFVKEDRDFYKSLKLYWEDETTIYVHAGIDLRIRDMASQDSETLLWIRDRFFKNAAEWHGKQIVFGHTPTRSMGLSMRSIFHSHQLYGIDTGAVYGGWLTALDTVTHQTYQQRGLVRAHP